jgi:autotransporter-associated beta strand protein
VNKFILNGGTNVIGGNSTLEVNTLTIGAGGLEITGGQMKMNLGNTGAGNLGSKIELNGNVTSFESFLEAGIFGESAGGTFASRTVDLGASTRTFTVADGSAINDLRVQFPIVGAGGLSKAGPGQLLLEGANTFAGQTSVDAGTLMLTGSLAGTVTVGVNGTLSGTGSIAGVTASSGALAPGAGFNSGTLDFADVLSFGTGSSLIFEVSGGAPGDGFGFYDQVNMTNALGSVSLASNVTFSFSFANGYAPLIGDDFYLLTRADAGTYGGIFAGLPEGAIVDLGDGYFGTITYQADWTGSQFTSFEFGGNDVAILNVDTVPEPGTCVTLLGGLAMLAGLRRRRQPRPLSRA